MKLRWIAAAGVVVFMIGLGTGVAVARKKGIDPSLYQGQEPRQAMLHLMELAETQAGKGSWENLHVARFYLLAGETEKGQAVLDKVLSRGKDVEASDWIRIGRIYVQLGDWDKARDAFETVISMKPKDEDWLAEIGAFYNLNGNRERAEELFARSFELDDDNHHNTAMAAGSYVGVTPR
jgi:tetratricopeptide (TPR) repeat protein